MPLISCPECTKQVSSLAPTCLGCGAPIAGAQEAAAAGSVLTTVQETSKHLKLHSLGSTITVLVSFLFVIVTAKDGGSTGATLFLVIGLVWFVVTRFRIWWHHK